MTEPLSGAMRDLTSMQRKAATWERGSLLVLAGPGAGKTRVLACRVAQLLNSTPNERFRVLALTFTNKAAHEMKTRIATMAPDVDERAYVDTFHGFCAKLLRQHGSHCGVRPSFEIYSQPADRKAVLTDVLRRHGDDRSDVDFSWLLSYVDRLKAGLVLPKDADLHLRSDSDLTRGDASFIGRVYEMYERELMRLNALDFNSLLILAYDLLAHPAIARHYRTVYRYWFIDEFQDTSESQYKILRRMAGDDFNRLFAVADDDQTIFEWRGANVNRIHNVVNDFGCHVIQLTENFRCPASVVEAGNRLLVYNARRDESKAVAKSAVPNFGESGVIKCWVFSDDREEARFVAKEIAALDAMRREATVVLARSRGLLDPVRKRLKEMDVSVTLLGRRDDFASPHVRWLAACLRQHERPLDVRNMAALNVAFEMYANVSIDTGEVTRRSEVRKITLLNAWLDIVRGMDIPEKSVVEKVADLAMRGGDWLTCVTGVLKDFEDGDHNGELSGDLSAWRRIDGEIRSNRRHVSLDVFLQGMALRSKEPTPDAGAVCLSTVHGAKGLEFDRVYLIGLAEEIFPSWHSVVGGSDAAMEEERRNCFVAITRTKGTLILSRAQEYQGWQKKPSRFLAEMEIACRPVRVVAT